MTQTENTQTQAQVFNPLADTAFDPREHLIDIGFGNNKAKYLQVQWRLVWFRKFCPQGKIRSIEVEIDLNRPVSAIVKKWDANARRMMDVKVDAFGYARYKAIVEDGRGGYAEATKTENAAEFTDFVEKAETGAIGRALASLGYGTQFTADELWDRQAEPNIVDAPVNDQHFSQEQPAAATPDAEQAARQRQQEKRANPPAETRASAPKPANPPAAADKQQPARPAPAENPRPSAPAQQVATMNTLVNAFTKINTVDAKGKPVMWTTFMHDILREEIASGEITMPALLNSGQEPPAKFRLKLTQAIKKLREDAKQPALA